MTINIYVGIQANDACISVFTRNSIWCTVNMGNFFKKFFFFFPFFVSSHELLVIYERLEKSKSIG